jgi:hypothetical protein
MILPQTVPVSTNLKTCYKLELDTVKVILSLMLLNALNSIPIVQFVSLKISFSVVSGCVMKQELVVVTLVHQSKKECAPSTWTYVTLVSKLGVNVLAQLELIQLLTPITDKLARSYHAHSELVIFFRS